GDAALVVEATIALLRPFDEAGMFVIQLAIQTHLPEVVAVRRRDNFDWLSADAGRERQLIEDRLIQVEARLFAGALVVTKKEKATLLDRPPKPAAELLAAESGFRLVAEFRQIIVRVDFLVAREEKTRTVKLVRAALADDVERRALAAPRSGRETLCFELVF